MQNMNAFTIKAVLLLGALALCSYGGALIITIVVRL